MYSQNKAFRRPAWQTSSGIITLNTLQNNKYRYNDHIKQQNKLYMLEICICMHVSKQIKQKRHVYGSANGT